MEIDLARYKVHYNTFFGVEYPTISQAIDSAQAYYGEVGDDSDLRRLGIRSDCVDENDFTALCALLFESFSVSSASILCKHKCASCSIDRAMQSFLLEDDRLSPRCSTCRRSERRRSVPPMTHFITTITGNSIQDCLDKVQQVHTSQMTAAKECAMGIECVYEVKCGAI